MKVAKSFLCGAMALFLGIGLAFAQDAGEAVEPVVNKELKDLDIQWVWGEVLNIDTVNKIIIVKYLDYEDNQEKEVSIGVDLNTAYENIKSLEEIKQQDFLNIDYVVNSDGKNVAKNIGLDKLEEPQVAGQEEAKKQAIEQ